MEKEIAAGVEVHPVIAALEKADEPTVVIHGYRGTSDDAVVRLYHALDTSAYVEIPKAAVIYLEAEKSSEPSAVRAFVRASSEILSVQRCRMRAADWPSIRVADWPPQLPPLQRRPSFWTCAGGCETTFVNKVSQILVDESSCLIETNPQRAVECRGRIETDKFEAKRALNFCLSLCIDTYGAPLFMAVPDDSAPGGFRIEPFSLGGYHQMLVSCHLEKPG